MVVKWLLQLQDTYTYFSPSGRETIFHLWKGAVRLLTQMLQESVTFASLVALQQINQCSQGLTPANFMLEDDGGGLFHLELFNLLREG